MTKKLTKNEQKIMSLFGTRHEEDGAVRVYTIPLCHAAWKLAERGLVTCILETCQSTGLDRGAYGRWISGTTSHTSSALKIKKINQEKSTNETPAP